ncbi:MAG: DUF1592 domain-containing protein [Saccharospirillaceae bacterium]|nr:DUF1592 domain-containing protein [Pseudomonadales bacterium]NRB77728.1 DUF1592 domain-containing protein [Saccharospirillaceae bacterium]
MSFSQVIRAEAEDLQELLAEPTSSSAEQLYIQHCSDCHGISGMGSVGNPKVFQCFRCVDADELTAYIDSRMPPQRRHDCIGQCAKLVSDYILDTIGALPAPQLIAKKMTARRLNKRQYKNTVRDLVGIQSKIADTFPDDDFGNGFDRMGDVLSLSPLLFELYLKSANQLADTIVYQNDINVKSYELSAEQFVSSDGQYQESIFNLWSTGSAITAFDVQNKGDYDFKFYHSSHPAGDEPAQFLVYINDTYTGPYQTSMLQNDKQTIEFSVLLNQGLNEIKIEFINDYYDPETKEDRNLLLGDITLNGPTNTIKHKTDSKLLFCDYLLDDSTQCAEQIIQSFAQKSWRRELSNIELKQLFEFFESITSQPHATKQYALSATFELILSSANFIFQIEPIPEISSGENQDLDDYAIASRLSYFLWDSMPDSILFNLAKNNQLLESHILETQIIRMLNDEKSTALLEGFFGQWLLLNAMQEHSVDKKLFPKYKKGLAKQLVKETQLLLLDYIQSDEPFKNILTNNYTYANKFLANFYGFKGDFGKEFSKVSLQDYPNRWGLLSQASLLTVTSHPNRTSVVKRGKWVMSNFLCQDPPPPPPGVEGIADAIKIEAKTLRQQMQIHASTPQCQGCHVTMDAIGFAFEQYDAIGQFRTHYENEFIDSTGSIKSSGKNKKFTNAQELAYIIKDDVRFESCVVKKLYSYALSSGITSNDELFIKGIVKDWQTTNGSFTQLVKSIVQSDAFLTHSYYDQKPKTQTNAQH